MARSLRSLPCSPRLLTVPALAPASGEREIPTRESRSPPLRCGKHVTRCIVTVLGGFWRAVHPSRHPYGWSQAAKHAPALNSEFVDTCDLISFFEPLRVRFTTARGTREGERRPEDIAVGLAAASPKRSNFTSWPSPPKKSLKLTKPAHGAGDQDNQPLTGYCAPPYFRARFWVN